MGRRTEAYKHRYTCECKCTVYGSLGWGGERKLRQSRACGVDGVVSWFLVGFLVGGWVGTGDTLQACKDGRVCGLVVS